MLEIRHVKVSPVADSGDPDLVQPSDWNDVHEIVGIDDGETGWTPALFFDDADGPDPTAAITVTGVFGRYYIISGLCHFYARINWTGLTGSSWYSLTLPSVSGAATAGLFADDQIGLATVQMGDGGIYINNSFESIIDASPAPKVKMALPNESSGFLIVSGVYPV